MCTATRMPNESLIVYTHVYVQCPSVHELLKSSFIRGAKEMCGLESVFDLYWKHQMKKDKQLHDKLNSDRAEWNLDEE